jgi:hypothetical protein
MMILHEMCAQAASQILANGKETMAEEVCVTCVNRRVYDGAAGHHFCVARSFFCLVNVNTGRRWSSIKRLVGSNHPLPNAIICHHGQSVCSCDFRFAAADNIATGADDWLNAAAAHLFLGDLRRQW